MPRPQANEYPQNEPPYMLHYISLVEGDDIASVIGKYNDAQINFISALPDSKANYAYAEGKWTVKEALQHIIDTERVFAYRALCIARGEAQTLPGFDQNVYLETSNANQRSFNDLKEEFKAVRYATNILLQSLNSEQILRVGSVADYKASANAFAYTIYGHFIHHQNIFEERYL